MRLDTVIWETQPRAVLLTINRPERNNSINPALVADLCAALDAAEAMPACRVVVIQGGPGLFCTGMDFHAASDPGASGDNPMEVEGYMALLKRLAASPKVIVSKVEGRVLAGGVGIAAASDLVIASARAEFSLSEALWGILPCCVLPFLIRRVGFQKAYTMTLTTRPVSAAEAAAMHLVDELTEAPDEAIRRLLLRLGLLEDETILELKRYFQKMWILSPEMERVAVAEISRLVSKTRVKQGIANFVATGRFPWEDRRE